MMLCPNGHETPENNKFCGECGVKMPPKPLVMNDYFHDQRREPALVEGVKRQSFVQSRQEPRAALVGEERRRGHEVENERPVQPSREVRQERAADPDAVRIAPPERVLIPVERRPEVRSEAPQETVRRAEPVVRRETPVVRREEPAMVDGISGPSILGLNYAPTGAYAEKSSDPSADYLLEDEPVRRGVSWRAVALLLLIIGGGALGYMQWRANHSPDGKPNLEKILSGKSDKPSANGEAAKPGASADDQATISSQSDRDNAAKSGEQQPSAQQANQQNPAQAQTNQQQPTAPNAASENPAEQNAQAEETTPDGVTVKSGNGAGVTVNSDGQAKHGTADEQNAKPESDQTPDAPKPPDVRPKPKAAKFTDEPSSTPMSLGEKDPIYQQALGFVQGRGVPRDCQRGVRMMLRSANDDNPKAAIQLGAMYATGNCVVPDRVQAYRWFSRALAIDPQNRYVRKTRDSLWINMSDTERAQSSVTPGQ